MKVDDFRQELEKLFALIENQAILERQIEGQKVEIDRLKVLNDQVSTRNQTLRADIQNKDLELARTTAILEKVIDKLKAITSPPNSFAYFLRFVDDNTADIIQAGTRIRVAVSPDIGRDKLRSGTCVILANSTNAVIDVDTTNSVEIGVRSISVIKERLNSSTAIVKDKYDNELVVHIPDEADIREKAVPDARAIVSNGFIVEVLKDNTDDLKLGNTSQYLLAEVPDVEFDDIGGLDKELELIRTEIQDSFEIPQLYELYSIEKETHIILYGLPGNGKTMIAKAIAKTMFDRYREQIIPHASGNFFTVRGPELEVKWVGESERMLREVFDSAASLAKKSNAPVFIFFDDCEAFLLRRGAGISSDVNMGHVTQFLTLLEGVREIKGVNVILASNRIDLIDPAVISRMRLKIRVPEPAKESTTKIFRNHLRKAPLDSELSDVKKFPDLDGDRNKILDHVVRETIEALYRDSKENEFLEIIYQDETSQVIKTYQLISGRIVRDIVDRAKKIAKNRDKSLPLTDWPTGISTEDLLQAMNIEFRHSEGLPTTKELVIEWLRQKGITKEVDFVRKLFGEQTGKRRINHPVQ